MACEMDRLDFAPVTTARIGGGGAVAEYLRGRSSRRLNNLANKPEEFVRDDDNLVDT